MKFTKKPFKDRIADTGYLLKNSFTIIGKDKDIKTPTIHMIILSVIMTTFFWFSLTTFFAGKFIFIGILLLLFNLIILLPFSFFYNTRKKADQSWIVYNTLTGKDISYADAHAHTSGQKGQLRFIPLLDIIIGYVTSQRSEKGIIGIILNLFLAALKEIWDLLSHYMLPAVVIEQKSLKEIIPEIKAIKTNVPATLTGVFGIDFVGSVVKSLFGLVYVTLFAISIGLGYGISLMTTETVITIGSFSFSWVPVLIGLYISGILSSIFSKLVESVKVIYFTIFYTSIMRPTEISTELQNELTHYLNMDKSVSADSKPAEKVAQKSENAQVHSESNQPNMQQPVELNEQAKVLIPFIKQYLAAGQGETEIRYLVQSKGYLKEDVDAALIEAKK